MQPVTLRRTDVIGLARPALDAHTLGLSSLAQLLAECGYRTVAADGSVCASFSAPELPESRDGIARWIRANGITVLGFSYRLDPETGARLMAGLVEALKSRRLLQAQNGPLRSLYFAGLPSACAAVRQHVPEVAGTFDGEETGVETLERLGVQAPLIPRELAAGARYDEDRLAFGRDLVRRGAHLAIEPPARAGYADFGTARDSLTARLDHAAQRRQAPLVRAHAGPYSPDRRDAVRLFLEWARQLAASGHLDVLSIGTSQLTQSAFGEDWANRPNGGGVPIHSPEEYADVWRAARPMLVRTYAGTRNLRELAQVHEERLHIAWHALSLWWFCRLDGRGPYGLRENLAQQLDALRFIAGAGTPYEPNVAHHFAFRGADDVTCVVASALAARTARRLGLRHLVLQVMLNTPRGTWGVQDLAKARAMLALARELEGPDFRVTLQPRGGLDHFSAQPEKARAQLAAVTALMDDIEPQDETSPPLIHVVSYSEGYELATPPVIDESIQITRCALAEYRRLRRRGDIEDMARHRDVQARTAELLDEARLVLTAMEADLPPLYTAEGLYQAFARGFLPVPYLWECREELERAVRWQTRLTLGRVMLIDERSLPLAAAERVRRVRAGDGSPAGGCGG